MPTPINPILLEKYPMVSLITYVIGLFDPFGIDHSERVAKLCHTMGVHLQYSDKELEVVELSGLLHDIGKLAMPEQVRLKPGRLTEAEFYMIQQHCQMGVEIMSRMNGHIDPRVREAILAHHENWDGSGYPLKLKGDAIPIEARIVRICDSYDAITHSRGYRMPVKHIQALDILEIEQAEQKIYDPELFRAFLTLMRGRKIE